MAAAPASHSKVDSVAWPEVPKCTRMEDVEVSRSAVVIVLLSRCLLFGHLGPRGCCNRRTLHCARLVNSYPTTWAADKELHNQSITTIFLVTPLQFMIRIYHTYTLLPAKYPESLAGEAFFVGMQPGIVATLEVWVNGLASG